MELRKACPTDIPERMAVLGNGRLGTAMVRGLRAAGVDVVGPLGRAESAHADAILLCVPDAQIPSAAAAVAGFAPLIGHTSGATPLAALNQPAIGAFGLHPLQTFVGNDPPERFHGVSCAVAGTTPPALSAARGLADVLGMRAFEIRDADRAAYHGAACISSNFLITLQWAAEELAHGAGIDGSNARAMLVPLVRATVDNWAELGPAQALTGPVARGDQATVAEHRAAIERIAPHLLSMFDVLVDRTRALAAQKEMS